MAEEKKKKVSLTDQFTDALKFVGPQLGALLLGGVDAMETTDRIMTGMRNQEMDQRRIALDEKRQKAAEEVARKRLELEESRIDARERNLEQARRQAIVKQQVEDQDALIDADNEIRRMDNALEVLNRGKGSIHLGVTGGFDATVKRAGERQLGINPEIEEVRKYLQQMKVSDTLKNTAQTKGAISDKEMALFESPLPSLIQDSEENWIIHVKEKRDALENVRRRLRGELPLVGQDASEADILKQYGLE